MDIITRYVTTLDPSIIKQIKYSNKKKGFIKRVNLLTVAMEGDKNLFAEIRKMKHAVKLESTSIDGHQGDANIAQHFL